jgi:hypothetical protein
MRVCACAWDEGVLRLLATTVQNSGTVQGRMHVPGTLWMVARVVERGYNGLVG